MPVPVPQHVDSAITALVVDELSLDLLTAGISVFQRKKGHRFSSDDVVTAWVAMQVCPAPARALDLGCGLGSVLLHLAWSAPQCALVGVEAQAVSFALLQKNIAHNRLDDRVTVHHADLRDPELIASLDGPFGLITGTPPYFPADTATDAMDAQRAYARIEYRGGIESYVDTAAQLLAADGSFVVCADADAGWRVDRVAASSALAICGRYVVVPRAGRPPLFTVWVLRHQVAAGPLFQRRLTLRDEAGERTDDAKMLRAFSGFPESAIRIVT
jgi:tRNA1Val (adenine37-N6)-methyltransferase